MTAPRIEHLRKLAKRCVNEYGEDYIANEAGHALLKALDEISMLREALELIAFNNGIITAKIAREALAAGERCWGEK